MMVAPPMAQVVHTMLAHVLFVPPSLSASSREPSASVASTATVMAVPSAMGSPTLTLVPILVRTKQERELRCVALRNDVPVGAEGLLVPPAGVERAGGARGRVLIE